MNFSSPEKERQMKTVQIKTPLGLQTFLWKDRVLVRPEDLSVAEIIDMRERWAQLRTSPIAPAVELDSANLQPMWG